MTDTQGHSEIKTGSERDFGLVFTVFFFIVALWPVMDGGPVNLWAIIAAIIILAITLLAPRLLRPLNIIWHKFGIMLGMVMVPLVMSLMFFLGVTPMGILMRLMGKDFLRLAYDPRAGSYWIERNEKDNPMGSMKFQF